LRRPGPTASTTPAAVAAGVPVLALGLAGLLAWALPSVPDAGAATIPNVPNVPAEARLASANQRVSADRVRATAISVQIQSEGLLLAKYAERADAEAVRSAQLDTQLRATRHAATAAKEEVLSARRLLVAQAIAAYTSGGAFSYRPGTVEGSGLVVAAAYAEAVAQRQQLALSDYRNALARDKAVFSELSRQKASVRAATRVLTADRAAASAQQSSLRTTLASVKGDLKLAVAEVERQQEAVQAEEEKALLQSINQLPKATPVMAAQRSPLAGGAKAAADGSPSSGPENESSTTAAPPTTTPTTTGTSPPQPEVPLAAAVTGTEAPTTTTSAPASTQAPSSTTTPTAQMQPSISTTTLAPTTTATTSPPSTPSTTATLLSATTSAAGSPTGSSISAGSSSASSISASSTTVPTPSTSEGTTSSPTSSSTSSTSAAGDVSGAGETGAGETGAGETGAGETGAGSAELAYSSSAGASSSSLLTPTTPTTPTTSTTQAQSAPESGLPASGWQAALAFAESQIGKPYQWGGAGPATYDCSGLTMVAWAKAGVDMPHSAQDQYNMTARVPISDLQPGDLVFFGTPTDVYHVGMYVGGGNMVDAPETGQDVMIQPIYELNLLAGGRPS
jgi:peptidoglycan DL-endopeptidase CwlO